MPEFPPGHAFHYAVYVPAPSAAHLRETHQNPYLTIPDDLTVLPDWPDGLVLEIQEAICIKCRQPYGAVAHDPICAADSNPEYLRGGKKDRAWRQVAAPGTSAREIATRQQQRETPALMQASRIAGLS
ncbi:hypothetical protein [Nonomuraea sp. NPDC005650]|uniref:hypothetical protein n=1 Tax=Nonomuraea sp. NPDC005650 TaxID=3157045 RepID=UPI0033A91DC5